MDFHGASAGALAAGLVRTTFIPIGAYRCCRVNWSPQRTSGTHCWFARHARSFDGMMSDNQMRDEGIPTARDG